jgi:hypothetical protein
VFDQREPCSQHLYAVFGGKGMSERSKGLRDKAAHELRESRNGGCQEEKAKNMKRAAAYKKAFRLMTSSIFVG